MQFKRTHFARLLVASACALALTPAPARAEGSDTPLADDFAEVALQAQSSDERDAFAPEDGFLLQVQSSRPSCFDLRHVMEGGVERSYVTPVRQQNPFGSCWGFGAIAAAETSLLSSGLADDPATLNLSEKQVVWFNAVALGDTASPQYGEGMTFGFDIQPSARYDSGGLTSYATGLFASGVGPTSEDTETNYGRIFRYSGLNGEVVNDAVTWLDENGVEQRGFRKVYYSDSDDWSMPEAYRFWQDYQLRESYLMPSPSDCRTDAELAAANGAIKDQLLSHRAVAINFCAPTSQPGQQSVFNDVLSENWAQYDNSNSPSNHVVTIVGYDDAYPKGNFATEPPADGAWLVKNSWGSDLLDFPDNGYRHWGLLEGMDVVGSSYEATSQMHTGYFWLSYYDTTIRNPETYDFGAGDASITIDQHDFMQVTDYERYDTEGPNRMANVFTAARDERLEDISFMTSAPGTTVSWRVYLLEDDAAGPEDGECVAFADAQPYALGGYHRVHLDDDTPVMLAAGQRYAIVVEQRTPGGKYSITVNTAISEATSYNGSVWFEGIVNKGESFFYVDGAWRDLSDESIKKVLSDDRVSIDNFSIKGYASAAEYDPSHPQPDPPQGETRAPYLEVRRSTGALAADFELDQRDTAKFKCTIKGATDDVSVQPTFTWKVSDESILAVEPNTERQGAEAVVRPLRYGEAYLTVDAGIYGSCTVLVTVPKLSILGASIADADRESVYTGQPKEPEPQEVYASGLNYEYNYDLVRGTDYEVAYEDNVRCGRAEVIVRGIGAYGSEVKTDMWQDLSFLILPAKAHITNVVAGDGSIQVSFASQQESGISGYELSWERVLGAGESGTDSSAAGKVQTMRLGADVTSATIEGLAKGATYEVSLRAYVRTTDPHLDLEEDVTDYVEADHFGEADKVSCVVGTSAGDDSTGDRPASPGSKDSSAGGRSSKAGASPSTSAARGTLPRTGDDAYPILPALSAGCAFVIGGVCLRKTQRRGKHARR